jgi:hypothetical protein
MTDAALGLKKTLKFKLEYVFTAVYSKKPLLTTS